MDLTDLLTHLANLFGSAIGIGMLGSGMAKLLWRKALRQKSVWRLALASGLPAALCAVAGLWLWEHDGRMATYAAQVGSAALALWWFGFMAKR